MSEKIMIIGAGGHGKVIADIIRKSGDIVCGFLDDDLAKQGVVGQVSECVKYPDCKFVIAIGNNEIRKKIAETYPKIHYYTAVHPRAILAEGISIGEGSVVMANAVINADAKIGRHCIINTSAVIEHDNSIGDYVHISPGAVLCGTVVVGDGSHIGANTVVKNNITIGREAIVGCGGCVVKNLEDAGTYVGVPTERLEK